MDLFFLFMEKFNSLNRMETRIGRNENFLMVLLDGAAAVVVDVGFATFYVKSINPEIVK